MKLETRKTNDGCSSQLVLVRIYETESENIANDGKSLINICNNLAKPQMFHDNQGHGEDNKTLQTSTLWAKRWIRETNSYTIPKTGRHY